MSGKHYRASSAEPQRHSADAKRTSARTQTPAKPKTEEYEDLYSYEEPYGAKRGTRQSTNRKPAPVVSTPKKKSVWPPIAAVLCLLAAAGILFYIVWDLGFFDMIMTLLG